MKALLSQLAARGYRSRILAIHHLRDLQEDFEGCLYRGLLDEEVYQEHLSGLSFQPPDSLPEARSIIVVAVPQPRTRFTFTWHDRPLALDVPPTYLHWREAEQHVRALLVAILNPQGYQVAPAVLPEKLLVVRSGLGVYGRNNISYVPGLGSFHRPIALYSDAPCPADHWYDLRTLERCQSCVACQHGCPTGAIAAERFLLRAKRCLTFHNERPTDVPFPSWIDPAWHNCLVGCLHCQRVCPENRAIWPWVVEGASFTEEETSLLQEGIPFDQLPGTTIEKLKQSDLADLLEVVPRNLSTFLDAIRAS
jgi:epoxyqueuosine reductase